MGNTATSWARKAWLMMPPVCWSMKGVLVDSAMGGQLHGVAHRSVAAHETVREAVSHEDVVRAVVNEDGDGALLPQQTIAVAIFGTDGVFDPSGDRNFSSSLSTG